MLLSVRKNQEEKDIWTFVQLMDQLLGLRILTPLVRRVRGLRVQCRLVPASSPAEYPVRELAVTLFSLLLLA